MILRGYDPDQPMAPGDALTGFLTALGVSGRDIPHGVDERAARYRTQVAGRRMLVTLIGPRVGADPDATCALIELCARLPLALRVAAELAISRPTVPLTDLVTELADQQRRLVRRGNTDNTP